MTSAFKLIVFSGLGWMFDAMGAFLHDIGNSVHRTHHPIYSALLTDRIAEKILSKVYGEGEKMYMLKQEVMSPSMLKSSRAYSCASPAGQCGRPRRLQWAS